MTISRSNEFDQPTVWTRHRRKFLFYDLSLVFLILAGIAISTTICASNRGQRTVTTPFGVVRGETILPASEDDLPAITQYLGIPYGVAPAGQYRFNMAISAPKWTHQPKNAFKLSPVCIQSGLPQLSEADALKTMSSHRFDELHRIFPFLKPESEDCLYMNLYVPERPDPSPTGQLLSVLMIVHGGDYGWGAGSAYNASILAAYGQTVVVTVNYRLGVYGFLGRCESNSCTGNAGLSDLVAALKMLSNILPSFGADPASLTLLGWGSGASLISLLMASPITQPRNRLFRRAVLLDGTALSPWAMAENPQEYLLRLAIELRCVDDEKKGQPALGRHKNRLDNDAFQKQIPHVIRCVQEQNLQNLTAAARKIKTPTFLSAFAPIVDGQIVPNHPKYSFSPKYGALFRDIDLMVGTVTSPAHHLLPDADLENGFDLQNRDKILRTLTRNLFNFHRTEIFNAIVKEYTDWDNPKNHPKTLRGNVVAALSDALFTVPLIQTARMHSTDEIAKTSNTFMFVLTHEVERFWSPQSGSAQGSPRSGSSFRGSLSDDHLPYILGYPLSIRQRDAPDYGRFTSDDKGISRVLMQYISNFVKSGDPAKPQSTMTRTAVEERFFGTPWPQYSPATREAYLEISDRPRVKNYYRNAYVGFWSSFVPQLNRDTRDNNVPEDHNFLPNHFKRDTFFGTVRHYSSFHNDPFPPPPLPPTLFPLEALKKATATASSSTMATAVAKSGEVAGRGGAPESMLGCNSVHRPQTFFFTITVAVGAGFLILNICIYMMMIKRCTEERRKSKKRLKYQSYTVGHPSTSEINFAQHNNSLIQSANPTATVVNETTLKTDDIKLATAAAVRRSLSPSAVTSVSSASTLRNGPTTARRFTVGSGGGGGKQVSDALKPRGTTSIDGYAAQMSRSYTNASRVATGSQGVRGSDDADLSATMSASLHLGNEKLVNNRGGPLRQSYLLTNFDRPMDELERESAATKSSTFGTVGGGSAVRRLSLKEQEPLLSASSKTSTLTAAGTMIRPGISPTCPRHGRAAQMMLAAAAAAAVNRANSTGAQSAPPTATVIGSYGSGGYNEFGNGPIQVISGSAQLEGTLEEAQV